MAKNIVQDVVPGKRSIRNISVPSRRGKDIPSSSSKDFSREVPRERMSDGIRVTKDTRGDIRETERRPKSVDESPLTHTPPPLSYDFDYDIDRPQKKNRWGILVPGIIFLCALVFGIVSLFASAKVFILPKSQTIPLQITFSALKDQPAGQFGYQIASVSKSSEKTVSAGAEVQVNEKAVGTIVVYNNSNTVQNLVATTRFQTSAGLVYRITNPVSVPKATVSNGQTVPGSATASVVADQAGESYNIGLSDFTLPGLKGTPRFTEVYARSKTPMTGGFVGMRKSVDPSALTGATTELQNTLKEELMDQIAAQLPKNFVLFPSSVSYTFDAVTQKPSADQSSVVLSLSGTASAIIFDRVILSQKILLNVASTSTLQGQQVEIKNLEDLKFTLVSPSTLTKDFTGSISFQLSGDAVFVGLFDQNALKKDLLNMKKSDLSALLQAKYPSIIRADAKIFPIWKGSFPNDTDKITISIVDTL